MNGRPLAASAAVIAGALAFALWQMRGPEPLPARAPQNVFSAHRAMTFLSALLREEVPHPADTHANRVVRDRLVARFRELGYTVEVRPSRSCNQHGRCANIENIVAWHGPKSSWPAVLLVAHYDSVSRGPGASDDGAGVAALLEIARVVRFERRRNPIEFLITDGEEKGLLGAIAFAQSPDIRHIAVAINVENRGTSGPAMMFETSRGNLELIRAMRSAVDRPFASSLFYTVYDRMPNDTDATIFKRAGVQVLNFAAIGDVRNYHTAHDNLANVNLRTLQHHGDNVLPLARVLADSDLKRPASNAVYFDIFGTTLVAWPAPWTIWIAAVSLVLLMVALFLAWRRSSITAPRLAFGLLAIAAAVTVAVLLGAAGTMMWRKRIEQPLPLIAAAWTVGFAATLVFARLLARRATPGGLFASAALAWNGAAVAAAVALPDASYIFLVPAAAFSLAAVLRLPDTVAAAVCALAVCVAFLPLAIMLYTALGALSLAPVALSTALIATSFAWTIAPEQ